MSPRFLLYCGADWEYTLAKEREDWRREFGSMHKALDYAQSLAEDPTPILVYGPSGKEIIQGTIRPRRGRERRRGEKLEKSECGRMEVSGYARAGRGRAN